MAERLWERVQWLHRHRLRLSPWPKASGEPVRVDGGVVSEVQLADIWHEYEVVNRGLLFLRRREPGQYMTLCLVTRGLDYDEREFHRAKVTLAGLIVEFGALKAKQGLTARI